MNKNECGDDVPSSVNAAALRHKCGKGVKYV